MSRKLKNNNPLNNPVVNTSNRRSRAGVPAGITEKIRKVLQDDKIFWVNPEDLKPWPGNARKHGERQIAALMASVSRYGFSNPVAIDEDYTVLCGHGRLEAARRLNMKSIPAVIITGLTKAEKRAFVIADNKISDLAGWDNDLLAIEIGEIIVENEVPPELTGMTSAEIDVLLDKPIAKSESADPGDLNPEDMKAPAVSHPGDLWILGDMHRLYCGDSLSDETLEILMAGEVAQMIFTDPPYNVAIEGHVRTRKGHREFMMASGEMSRDEFTRFLNRSCGLMKKYSTNGSIHYICMDHKHIRELLDATEPVYGLHKQLVIWCKENGGMGSFYRSRHELIFVFKNGTAAHINNFGLGKNGRYRTNCWEYAGVNSFGKNRREELAMHPTVKPVALVADAIRDCSKRKGIILDPFCGSGTTIIAAERTGRIAHCIELDPAYVDVTVARWMRVTGKPVVLAQTGQTFEQVRAERSGESKPVRIRNRRGRHDL